MISPLPDIYLTIKGQQWKCIGTADTDEEVIDTLKNEATGEIRTIERMKLVTYLEKNKTKEQQVKKINVSLYSSNNQINLKL
jgi:hypothetical protein